jgi:hypothetical protein
MNSLADALAGAQRDLCCQHSREDRVVGRGLYALSADDSGLATQLLLLRGRAMQPCARSVRSLD